MGYYFVNAESKHETQLVLDIEKIVADSLYRHTQKYPGYVFYNYFVVSDGLPGIHFIMLYVYLPGLCTEGTLTKIREAINLALVAGGNQTFATLVTANNKMFDDIWEEEYKDLVCITIGLTQSTSLSAWDAGLLTQIAVDKVLGVDETLPLNIP